MSEFILPDLSQWLPEYQKVPWNIERDKLSHSANVYDLLSSLIRGTLEDRDPHFDYYEPLRPALLIETFHLLEPPVLKGAVAYAVSMLNNHPATRSMGAELCRGMTELSEWLEIPPEVVDHVNQILEQQEQRGFPAGSADIIRRWQEHAPDQPLATWYENWASAAGPESFSS